MGNRIVSANKRLFCQSRILQLAANPLIPFVLQAKHLQFVSGVHSTSYWTATFAWDLINALLPIVVSVILFAAFQVEAYTGDGLAAVFFLLVSLCIIRPYQFDYCSMVAPSCSMAIPSLSCIHYNSSFHSCTNLIVFPLQLFTVWASIPLTYCVSFLFSNPLGAFGVLMLFYYFVGFVRGSICAVNCIVKGCLLRIPNGDQGCIKTKLPLYSTEYGYAEYASHRR